MAKKPEKKIIKPTKPAINFDDDDDFDPDFTYKEAVETIREECPNIGAITPALEKEIRAFIKAIDDVDKDAMRETRGELQETLIELQGDDVSVALAIGKVFNFVDGGSLGAARESGADKRRKLLTDMETGIAGRIEGIRVSHSAANPEDKKGAKALGKMAKAYRDGIPGDNAANLLTYIADAALNGKLPQQSDAGYFEQLKRKLSDEMMQEALDGRSALTRRVMDDAILSAAKDVTAPLVGKVGK